MAYKLRLEYPGAIYHVINRGNYRTWVFREARTKDAFEACLFETCIRCRWVLHAFVVMSNHYHLAVETPQSNLVAGMQWLQSTFANRFNRLRGEQGHLFQGRYKALVVEPGEALGQVCHYQHLNPVRARMVGIDDLRSYRHSSYWYLHRPQQRPAFFAMGAALAAAGGLTDTAQGREAYAGFLAWQAAVGPAGRNSSYVSMSRGWTIGSEAFKRHLMQNRSVALDARAWPQNGATELRESRWQSSLTAARAFLTENMADSHRSATWKVAIAAYLKETTDAPNLWLARQLDMGSACYVSRQVGEVRRNPESAAADWLRGLRKAKGKA